MGNKEITVNVNVVTPAEPKYAVTIADTEVADVVLSATEEQEGNTVSVKVPTKDLAKGDKVTLSIDGTATELTYDGVTSELVHTFQMPAKEVSISITLEKAPVVLESIAITVEPNTEYTEGEALDLSGMEVTATMSDGSSLVVTPDSTVPADKAVLVLSNNELTINYQGKSTSLPLTINAKPVVVESITVIPPSKLEYTIGESINLTGMAITGNMSDGTTTQIDVSTSSNDAPDTFDVEGTQVITVTYNDGLKDHTDTFEVNVIQ